MDADQTEVVLSPEEREVLERHACEASEIFGDAIDMCADEDLDMRAVLPTGLTILALQILSRAADRDTGVEIVKQHIQNAVDTFDAYSLKERSRLC